MNFESPNTKRVFHKAYLPALCMPAGLLLHEDLKNAAKVNAQLFQIYDSCESKIYIRI